MEYGNKSNVDPEFSGQVKLKFLLCSLFGLFTYFVSFQFNGANSILVDHLADLIKQILGSSVPYVCLLMIIAGTILPFAEKTWNQNITTVAFTVFKILGVPLSCMYVFKIGPEAFFVPDMLPFLYEKLVMNLSFVIPLGSALLIFLTSYGLMDFIGVFARPFMRRIYKTPGRSAIDAVASFVGNYPIALIITGDQYRSGYYTKKEAVIVATGFSTVSAAFCIVVARTFGLMDMWNLFFWSTLIITFVVTALTVRLWPLCRIPDECIEGAERMEEPSSENGIFKTAIHEALAVASSPMPIKKTLVKNFIIGFKITAGLMPTIMSIGFLVLALAEFTPVFDVIGLIFYPFTALLGFSEAQLVAKALSLSIAEMFLPAALVLELDMVTKYVVAVTSISEILFFSASIPCMISTGIPISIKDMVIVWFERIVLTLFITTPIAWLFFR